VVSSPLVRRPVARNPVVPPPARSLRVLALIPDAFGSHGGISKFNRDLLTALCSHPNCAEVVALPRLMPESPGTLPGKLTWVTDGLGGKLRYLRAAVRIARRNPSPLGSQPPTTNHLRSCRPAVSSSSGQEQQPSTTYSQLTAEVPRGFDLVICGHINLLPAAFLARRLLSRVRGRAAVPLALFIHGLDVWDPHRSALVRSLVRRVDAFVSVSAFTRDLFVCWSRVSAANGLLLPNCVDLTGFRPGERDPVLLKKYGLSGRKVLMTLGRLLPDRPKGIDEVLETLPSLIVDFPQLSYLICGDGSDRPRLVNKARSLGLSVSDLALTSDLQPPSAISDLPSPLVVFAGRLPESEKAAHYQLADAFVMPGYGEGFGIVYLEALACGIPVLASTLDASREALLDGEMGLLVDPRNRAELRQGFLQVLQQPRGQVPPGLEHFSFPHFVKRCHAIIDNLCPAAIACS